MVKPIPVSSDTPNTCRQPTPAGKLAEPEAHGKPGEAEHAGEFAEQQPERDAHGDRMREHGDGHVHQWHAGIGQCEQRQDGERHPGMQRDVRAVRQRRLRRRAGNGIDQPQHHAGQRRVHPGLEHRQPQQEPDHQVRRQPRHAGAVEHRAAAPGTSAASEHRQPRQLLREQHRDQHDGAEVVDDRERQQEDAQRRRRPRSQQGQHAQRECDVGGRRDRPAGEHRRLRTIAPGIHQRRHQHATQPPRSRATAARLRLERSPTMHSRLISMPTSRKNTAMRPSLIQCSTFLVSASGAMPTVTGRSSNSA